MTRATSRNAGFTLIELAVVIFIISLVTALVLPSFTDDNRELGAEARKAAAVLRYLSETATLKKRTLRLEFDFDEGTIAWTDGKGDERTESLDSLMGVELQTRGMVKEGTLTIFFAPLGASEYMKVYLGRDDRDMTVTINPVSGRVRILDGSEI